MDARHGLPLVLLKENSILLRIKYVETCGPVYNNEKAIWKTKYNKGIN